MWTCVVSYSISTSNHNTRSNDMWSVGLYLIPFLHQTTTNESMNVVISSCILFHFYIKPQPREFPERCASVVSYSISTSNHNIRRDKQKQIWLYLIPFLHQTTTLLDHYNLVCLLYLIPFLHQTTTVFCSALHTYSLYLIPFLHQTTTYERCGKNSGELYLIPFLHQTTTVSSTRSEPR